MAIACHRGYGAGHSDEMRRLVSDVPFRRDPADHKTTVRSETQTSDFAKRLPEMVRAGPTLGGGEGEGEIVDQRQDSSADCPGTAKLMPERGPESSAFGM